MEGELQLLGQTKIIKAFDDSFFLAGLKLRLGEAESPGVAREEPKAVIKFQTTTDKVIALNTSLGRSITAK